MTNTASDANNDTSNERVEVLHNKEIIVKTYLQVLHHAKKWDYFAETKSLSLVPLEIESLNEALINAKRRGVKPRFITEITKDNISYTKEFVESVELRHLDGVKGNYAVSDTEYVTVSTTDTMNASLAQSKSMRTTLVYSNVIEDVRQMQYVFEAMWNKATPAEQRIREIEEDVI